MGDRKIVDWEDKINENEHELDSNDKGSYYLRNDGGEGSKLKRMKVKSINFDLNAVEHKSDHELIR